MVKFIFRAPCGKYHQYLGSTHGCWSLTEDPRKAFGLDTKDAAEVALHGIMLSRGLSKNIPELAGSTICLMEIRVTEV